MRTHLIIEGSRNQQNGSLRVAFGRLLEKAGLRNIKVVMAGSWSDVLKKYAEYPTCTAFILVDSDALDPAQAEGIPSRKRHTMTPSFEEWLILEGQALCQHYGLSKPPKARTGRPEQAIKDWIKTNAPKRVYHKVRDATAILPRMDVSLLREKAPAFSDLIKELSVK